MSETRPIVYPKGTTMFLGTEVRGLVSILSETLPPLRFGEKKGDKYILPFNMDDPVKRAQYEAAINGNDFKNGTIFKMKSGDEVRAEAKEREQAKNLELIKDSIKKGLFNIPLSTMSWEQLLDLGDKIGAQTNQLNPKTKVITKVNKSTILASIREKLGIEKDNKVEEPVEENIPEQEVING